MLSRFAIDNTPRSGAVRYRRYRFAEIYLIKKSTFMTRQWRIEYEGALYHVLSRGNEGRSIVEDNQDRISFLNILGRMHERFDIDILAYVLMNNHYHLVVRTNRSNLSRSMQWFGVTYTRYFNVRYERSGHLFQGRFKSFLIENSEYLLRVSYYIHRNPLRAGAARRLSDFRWSSYRTYGYGRQEPSWLDTATIPSQFPKKESAKAYRKEVQRYAGEKGSLWEEIKHGLIMGSDEFVDHIRDTYLSKKPDREMPQQKRLEVVKNASALLKKAQLPVEKKNRDERDLLIYALWEKGWYTNQDIGDIFDLTYSAVSRRVTKVKERIARDKGYHNRYRQVKSQLAT